MSQLTHAPRIKNLQPGVMENIKKMFDSEGGKYTKDKPRDSSPVVSMRHKVSSPRPAPRQVLPIQSIPVKLRPVTLPPEPPDSVQSSTDHHLKHYSCDENTEKQTHGLVFPTVLKRVSAFEDPHSKKEDVSVKQIKPVKVLKPRLKTSQDLEERTADVKPIKTIRADVKSVTNSRTDVKPVAGCRVGKPESNSSDSKLSSVGKTSSSNKPVSKSKTDECIYKPRKLDGVTVIKLNEHGTRSQTTVSPTASHVDSKQDEFDGRDENKNRLSATLMNMIGDEQNGGAHSGQRTSDVMQTSNMSERINVDTQILNKKNPLKTALAPPKPTQPPRPRPRAVRQNSIGCASEYEYSPIWVESNVQFNLQRAKQTDCATKPQKQQQTDKGLNVTATYVPSGTRNSHPKTGIENSVREALGPPPRPPPPLKPPRTGAHDVYIESKARKSQEVVLEDNELYIPLSNDGQPDEQKSVKARVSTFQENLPQTKDDSVIRRRPLPFRPPVPKRPISIATDWMSVSQPSSPVKVKPKPEKSGSRVIVHEYEEIKESDFRPPGGNSVKAVVDELTHRPLQRFPLRKSFSSDNLCPANLCDDSPVYIDPALSKGFNKFQEETYEAYIDEEGYAIPHAFVKKHAGDKKHLRDKTLSAVNQRDGVKQKFGAFRRRFDSDGQQKSIPVQEQDLKKVNKRKMNQVMLKVNDAFAALQKHFRGDQEQDVDGNGSDLDTISVESDVDNQEIKRRVEYVCSIKAKTYYSIKMKNEFKSRIYPQLFEYALVVGLKSLPGGGGFKPYIIHKFPEIRTYKVNSDGHLFTCSNLVDSNMSVPLFCFPDAAEFESTGSSVSESYHFVLTNIDGGKVYGYCRRMQHPESKLPEVICIISPVDAFNMYYSLLNEVEKKRGVSLDLAQELLAASFGRPLPNPGKVVHIRSLDQAGEMETIFLNRPTDSRLENVNYECLLSYLGTDKLLKVFSTLLMERRVLVCSKNLSTLSQTVHALAALLYPFQWQHIYIPILPQDMLDVCASPTPFLIGILSSHLKQVMTLPLEEVIIVDLDKKQIVSCVGDESSIIPNKLQKALKTAINMCKIDADARSSQWLMVSEAFMRLFVETIGHYGEYIQTQQDGQKTFRKDQFVAAPQSKGIRQMLEWFTESQMFEVFITDQLEKTHWGSVDLFMSRLSEFKKFDDGASSGGLGKKVMKFLRKL